MGLKVKSLLFSFVLAIIATIGLSQVLPVFGNSPASTERISVSSTGAQADGIGSGLSNSSRTAISSDGRYVAFQSYATNLVTPSNPTGLSVYLRDQSAGITILVATGSRDASISADGRYIAFASGGINRGVFVYDQVNQSTERIDVTLSGGAPSHSSSEASISANGRYVVFGSDSPDLVAGDINGFHDIFMRDRTAGTTARISVDSSGSEANNRSDFSAISADGRYIAFDSTATNLVPGDTNGVSDFFVRDTANGTTERVSVSSSGTQSDRHSGGPLAISADGRFVTFTSLATNLVSGDLNNLVDVFLRDRLLGATEVIGNLTGMQEGGTQPSISSDGRYVGFISRNQSLVTPDTNGSTEDVYVYDRQLATYERASVSTGGVQQNAKGVSAQVSSTGRYVIFSSQGTNLVPGDTNDVEDVFLRDRGVFDDTPPTVSNLAFSANPKGLTQNSTLSVDATDENDVQRVEYYLDTDPGQGNGTEMTLASGDTYTAELGTSLAVGTYQVYVRALDTQGNWSNPISEELVVSNQLTSVSPANIWVGLKNSDSVGVKFDFLAETYIGDTLITSGQLNSAPGGSSGFNNAKLNTVVFDSFSPVNIPQNAELKIKLYVRNACVGSGHNSGVARLWYNDSAANSRFDATIDSSNSDYYLLDSFLLSATPGSGPKKTIDVQSGTKCSPFKPFGTWTTTLNL